VVENEDGTVERHELDVWLLSFEQGSNE